MLGTGANSQPPVDRGGILGFSSCYLLQISLLLLASPWYPRFSPWYLLSILAALGDPVMALLYFA
jgi:hypothetical protein